MMDAFVDPLEALVRSEGAALVEADTRALGAPQNQTELVAQHASKIIVAITKVKSIVLSTIRSYVFTQDVLDVVWDAQKITIRDKDSQTRAWELIKALKDERKRITKFYKEMRDPYNAVSEAVRSLDDRDATFVTDAEQRLDRLLNEYDIAEAAREEVERKRLQAIEDEKARATQRAAAASLERVAETEVDQALKNNLLDRAQAIATQSPVGRRAVAPSNRAAVKGVGFGGWRYTGTVDDSDKQKLIDDINAGTVGLDAILVNPAWIKARVDEHKEQTSQHYAYIKVSKDRSTRG